MANVLIVAYLLIVLALIAVILLQRSEGGALGIGGGGGGFMTARGSANLLTRTTAILATLFFATAIGLTILSEFDRPSSGILERATQGTEGGETPSVLDALNSLSSEGDADLALPEAPVSPSAVPVAGDAPDLALPSGSASTPTAQAAPEPAVEAPAAEIPAAPAGTAPMEPATGTEQPTGN